MKRVIANKMLPLVLPAGLVAIACLLLFKIPSLPVAAREMLEYFSYGIFFVTLILSYWFNRSRIFFVAIILAASQLLMTELAPPGIDRVFFSQSVYVASSVLIPANILFFFFSREKGIVTGRGKARASIVFIQVLFIYWAGTAGNSEIMRVLGKTIVSPGSPGYTPIPQLSIVIMAAAFLVMLTRLFFKPNPMDGSFIGILLSSAIALHLRDSSMAVQVFYTAAWSIMTIAVIQDSYRKAYLDELTGLPGRRALSEELEKMDGKYCIAMVDIDFFKKFNDTYGHDIGDEVLKLIAASIKNVTGGGKPFRYGGEEFTILFPGKKISQVVPHLESLRERIAGRAFVFRSPDRPRNKPDRISPPKHRKKISVTVSIGVSESSGRFKADDVLKSADQALYRAKEQGRNQVCR